MGMLDRYRKPGGFIQLLNLLETSGKEKQEKFLTLIRQEDPRWADELEKKILTIKKIFSWNSEILAEILGQLQDMTIAVAIQGLDEEITNKIYSTMSHSQKRKITSIMESTKPTPAEMSTMFMKILTEVRKMITEGKLRMDKIDIELIVDDEIEERLKKGAPQLHVAESDDFAPATGSEEIVTEAGTTLRFNFPPTKEEVEAPAAASAGGNVSSAEVAQLRKKLTAFQAENSNLKQEITRLKLKLDQIRKLSA